jgi:hypothetical protein
MPSKFPCPYCKGEGSWVEAVLDDGSGPTYNCGFCDGDGMIEIGSEKHKEIKRHNPPKWFMWELIGELGYALNQVEDALQKLPEGGWSEREHLLSVCRRAREFHYEPQMTD